MTMKELTPDIVLNEGEEQHSAREKGNPNSRLIYRGELMEVEQ